MKEALCMAVIAIAMLNFLAYAIIAACLGGDAINGRSENGHYYFSSHGKETEVSKTVFNYSRIHTYAVWTTHPLALVTGLILFASQKENSRGKKSKT